MVAIIVMDGGLGSSMSNGTSSSGPWRPSWEREGRAPGSATSCSAPWRPSWQREDGSQVEGDKAWTPSLRIRAANEPRVGRGEGVGNSNLGRGRGRGLGRDTNPYQRPVDEDSPANQWDDDRHQGWRTDQWQDTAWSRDAKNEKSSAQASQWKDNEWSIDATSAQGNQWHGDSLDNHAKVRPTRKSELQNSFDEGSGGRNAKRSGPSGQDFPGEVKGNKSSRKGCKGGGKSSEEARDFSKGGGISSEVSDHWGSQGSGGKAGQSRGGAKNTDHSALMTNGHPNQGSRGTGMVSQKHLSKMCFADLNISKESKLALKKGFGYEYMTEVQAATIEPLLAERDVVARAKTGTGKTLAFLLPIVERILRNPRRSGAKGNIFAIILSPTRELAVQISEEASTLLHFHSGIGVACFYGGSKISGDHRALASKAVDILVATPGRITDHLDNTDGFKKKASCCQFLALDEGDQLLDMGFRDAILRILANLPDKSERQGALFSATYPKSVEQVAKLALKADNDWVDTVRADEEVTPDQIDQSVCLTTMDGLMELLWGALHGEMARSPKDYKIMVFFCTARQTQLYSELFSQAGVDVLEVHSKKSQAHRNKCSAAFRLSRSGVIFSSDVSARGLDYPDVTAVLQVGIPSSRDQYIHRLGRTGRAGKSGRCILLLQDFEQFFLKSVKDLPIKKLDAKKAFPSAPAAPDCLWDTPPRTAGQAYQAWLGYYNSVKGIGWTKNQLVQQATQFAASICAVGRDGLPPPMLKKTVGMMGLKGVPGLNIVSALPYGD